MLTCVRFNNFRSFAREATIDLNATKSEILSESNVKGGVLKGCAFYGGNASGKTAALLSITVPLDLLFKPPFSMAANFSRFRVKGNMYFEYTFKEGEDTIVYYFEINDKGAFVKETLTLNGKRLLSRLANSAESLLTENQYYQADAISNNALFLRTIAFNTQFAGFPVLRKWFDYLSNSVYINPMRDYAKTVNFTPVGPAENQLETYIEKHGVAPINDFFSKHHMPFTLIYEGQNPMVGFAQRLSLRRENLSPICFASESYGTQLLLSILPSILTAIESGGIIAIDEFSSGFHNKLEEMLVRHIHENSINCQLVFVSHSTNLLKTSLIRPDQLYSVDFVDGSSTLKRFSDERPRESQNLEKMYLSGVFGGLPLYED